MFACVFHNFPMDMLIFIGTKIKSDMSESNEHMNTNIYLTGA